MSLIRVIETWKILKTIKCNIYNILYIYSYYLVCVYACVKYYVEVNFELKQNVIL